MMQTTTEPAAPGAPLRSGVQDDAKLLRARRRVAAIKGFYVHLFVFALVLAGLFAINAASGGSWWALWVLFGWGIGVVAHALAVFGRKPQAVAAWEERKVRQLANEP
jgi:fatty acid desaturase